MNRIEKVRGGQRRSPEVRKVRKVRGGQRMMEKVGEGQRSSEEVEE